MNSRKTFWGLIQRRECLIPTWRGALVFLLSATLLIGIAIFNIHPFLAVSDPTPAEILVVEGWLPDYALEKVKIEFERQHYKKLYVTGGPLEIGGHLSQYKTYAEIGAATLVKIGIAKEAIEAIPAPTVLRDRTHASAKALKSLLIQQSANNSNINLVSIGVHAKRSQLLFQQAFGDFARVGVIAIENEEYDPKRWWVSSEGVRTVINETIAYVYALVIFPFV